MKFRQASVRRITNETRITVRLNLDGKGKSSVKTGIGFFDHMLTLFAKHAVMDLTLRCEGDLEVDAHHTVEDCGLALGQAFVSALGDKRGIRRYGAGFHPGNPFTGEAYVPMDECLVSVSLDLGGRPYFAHDLKPKTRIVGSFDSTLVPDFFVALTQGARCTLHVRQIRGGNTHHLLEATFKAFGRALDLASQRDPRRRGVPSSKGRIG